tara:strand:- start:244 stop:1305 length:1062 start_codon:yes stop_codon:yes gene_type:complete
MHTEKYSDAILSTMANAMKMHEHVFIIGQGVTDHKYIFGSIKGLAQEYPSRVIETPIAEESVAGVCVGAALEGMYPVNTHIRADFALLTFNQLVNLAAKYKYMFGGKFQVPMMMRMIIGRSWGQGAQHSQSIQSMLAHIPGLVVVMPASGKSVRQSYKYSIDKYKGPVVMLEHRLMYDMEFELETSADVEEEISIYGSNMIKEGKDITIVATSIMVIEAKRAAKIAERNNINVEIIDLHSISHPDELMIVESVKKTGRLIVADTSWTQLGVCAEINRLINEHGSEILKHKAISIGMAPTPCPTAKVLEDMFYPGVREILDAIYYLKTGKKDHGYKLPDKESTTSFYKNFKGPF